mmetsp:Transcript_7829/g.10888  ORF Transcript_7829/g.10888 Transcript_7829/m.10888 type:complete len:172 (-) Transcript_7829:6-521(-)
MRSALTAVLLLHSIAILQAKHFRPICRDVFQEIYMEGDSGKVSCDMITGTGEETVKDTCLKVANAKMDATDFELFNPHSIVATSDECIVLWDAVSSFCVKQGVNQYTPYTIRKLCKKVRKESREDSASAVDSIQVAYFVMVGASCLICTALCSRMYWCYWNGCGRSKSPSI